MASPNDVAGTSTDSADLTEFRNLSRQMLYMALFDNVALRLSVFGGSDEGEAAGVEDSNLRMLSRFSRYLYGQMADELPAPDDLTIEAWAAMAGQVTGQTDQEEVDPATLADRLYRILKRELRIEQERLARRRV
jgi:hypothetical protein